MTSMPLLDSLTAVRFPDVKWDHAARPILIADGRPYAVRELDTVVQAKAAYVVGVNQRDFDHLARYLRATTVHFYEMRVADISALPQIGPVEALRISWNTKIASLEPIAALSDLVALSIDDVPKVRDLGPVGELRRLRAFEFSGGIWNRNTADSLAPIGQLRALEELRLANLRVLDGGLRPLAACAMLHQLYVSNQFPTADYAYLSVALPGTTCDLFHPYVHLGQEIAGANVMVVGSGMPLLHSVRDADRLRRYTEDFRRLQELFALEAQAGADVN